MIRQFWVMGTQGTCYFHRSTKNSNKELQPKELQLNDDNMVMGMFSAILGFIKEITNSDVKKFENYASKFLFFLDKNLIFVVEAELGASDKKVKKKIEVIKELFIKKYEKELSNFSGDVAQFRNFEHELDIVFKKISLAEEWGKELTGLKF